MGMNKMALINDSGKQRFVAVGDSVGSGTVDSISDTQIVVGGKVIELASRGGDSVTKGHAPARPAGQAGAGGKGGSLAIAKPQQQHSLGKGLNGEEIPAVPDYVRPERVGRYEQIRGELRGGSGVSTERELAELAGKVVGLEETDPSSAKKLLNGAGVKEPEVGPNKSKAQR
jgi:hypothetical protein